MNPVIHYVIEMIGATTLILIFCFVFIDGFYTWRQNRKNKSRERLLNHIDAKIEEYRDKDNELCAILSNCSDWIYKNEEEDD